MKIHSNKQLLNLISKHEVGIKYPELISRIAFNILIQKDTSIFDPEYSSFFGRWFQWNITREGYDYWFNIVITLLRNKS